MNWLAAFGIEVMLVTEPIGTVMLFSRLTRFVLLASTLGLYWPSQRKPRSILNFRFRFQESCAKNDNWRTSNAACPLPIARAYVAAGMSNRFTPLAPLALIVRRMVAISVVAKPNVPN